MNDCCGSNKNLPEAGSGIEFSASPLDWFAGMIDRCHAYATQAHSAGRPIVGIMCEFTPRELILAAGALPVCLCGGSAKTIPAAEEFLPSGLCPLIKSTFGYHVLENNPFLEMAALIVAETTCDGKKKMFELLGERRPMHVLELTQKETDPDALAHWTTELRKFRRALEERFNTEITDCKIREAIRLMNRERRLRRELAALMRAEAPPLTGLQLLTLKSSISGMPEDLAQYETALALYGKTEAADPALARRVRVLLTGVPVVSGAERVIGIIEGRGGLVVCQENCTGLKPILEDVDETADDPVQALAEKYFHLPCSVKTPNAARFEMLEKLAAEYRPHCIIELVWQGCLTYAVESQRTRRLAERLGLPYLRIETDYSPSDTERIAVRVEALFETVKDAVARA